MPTVLAADKMYFPAVGRKNLSVGADNTPSVGLVEPSNK